MGFFSEKGLNRREFFRTSGRYALLSGLVALAAITTVRRRGPGGRCVNAGLCNACLVFADCHLPQAISARFVKAGGGYESLSKRI
jgi:hypothetical protein